MDSDAQRTLGRLESAAGTSAELIKRVLDNQEEARRELLNAAIRFETKLEQHNIADAQAFTLLRDGIGGLRDRIARFEPIVDSVEVHGEAIARIETNLSDMGDRIDISDAIRKNNRAWQQGIIGLTGVAAGGAGAISGPRFWKWLLSLFGLH